MGPIIQLLRDTTSVHWPDNRVFDVRRYGAKPDPERDNAKFIQRAIDACERAGGGTVLIPAPHTFMTGTLELTSNMTLRVEPGATLLANPDESVYTKSAFRDNLGEGTMWLHGEGIYGLVITGGGHIDGNGIAFMGEELEDCYELKPFDIKDPRPHVLTIVGSENIRIHDVHVGNSAYWTIHLAGCDDVDISGVTILNSTKVRNSDGIDLDHCKNVRISDCVIESGDDCICLKNRREYEEFGACENITVTGCTMTSSSCAIKIGSENMDAIRHVVFDDCVIRDSNRGVGIQNRDEGTVSDIVFSNMTIESRLFSDVWWGKSEPIYVTAFRRASAYHKDANWRFPAGATEGNVGEVRDITFRNITCSGMNGIYINAESPDKIARITFDQVHLRILESLKYPGGFYDNRPWIGGGLTASATAGFYLANASDVAVRESSVRWPLNMSATFSSPLETHDVEGLKLFGFDTSPGP